MSRHPHLWLAGIVLFAAVMRFTALEYAPSGGHGDVSWVGVNALDLVDRGIVPFYVRELYAPEPFPVFLTGFLLPFTGVSYLPQRLITVVTGLMFIALLYPATWWLLGDGVQRERRIRAGLLAAMAGALSIHAMYLSRLGMESPPFLLVVTLWVWWTAWAWRRGGWWRWSLAGASLALTLYVYLPARLLPFVILLWAAHSYWADRERLRASWRGGLIMIGVAFVLALPALLLFVSTPEAFSARADIATSTTGGWIWSFDLSAQGGLIAVLLQKIVLMLLAFGIGWNGAYTIMDQPMLGPLFFIGFLVALVLLVRSPRSTALAWCALAIPVLFITDLISGAVVELHALHQMGVLPFVLILSGIGLSAAWDEVFAQVQSRSLQRLMAVGFLALAVVPAVVGMVEYLNVYIPAQYADPESGWRRAQIDVDVSRRITSQPEVSYLLPYSEYSRSDVGWLIAAGFRERRSAIAADSTLQISNPPEQITVVQTLNLDRPRHDGHPSHTDPSRWVLLHDGEVLFLPPLTAPQVTDLLAQVDGVEPERLIDRSGTEIAELTTITPLDDLFAPRSVITYPLDATFNGEFHLLGYDVRSQDLVPGQVVHVTLFWQRIAPTGEDYEIFTQLWNDETVSLAQAHDFPYGGMYRSRIWLPDEIVPTHHWMIVPDDLPVGRYTLAVGMYRLLQNEPVEVSGENVNADERVAIAPDFRLSPPAPQTLAPQPTSPIQFGTDVTVEGLAVQSGEQQVGFEGTLAAAAGSTVTVIVDWQALERPTEDYSAFLHLNAQNEPLPAAQIDALMGGDYPTGAWRSGDVVQDVLMLAIPADLVPGTYNLFIGAYYWQTGERLEGLLNGAAVDGSRIQIATVLIE